MTGSTEARLGQVIMASSALFLCGGMLPMLHDILSVHYSNNISTFDLLLPAGSVVPFVTGVGLIVHGTIRETNEQLRRTGGGKIGLRHVLSPRRVH